MVWNTETGAVVHRLDLAFEHLNFVSFSRDDTRLAAGSELPATGCLGPILGQAARRRAAGPRHSSQFTAILANRDVLVTAGDDGTIRVWDAKSRREIRIIEHDDGQNGVRWIRCSTFLRTESISPC